MAAKFCCIPAEPLQARIDGFTIGSSPSGPSSCQNDVASAFSSICFAERSTKEKPSLVLIFLQLNCKARAKMVHDKGLRKACVKSLF